jgi:hypothetical protein
LHNSLDGKPEGKRLLGTYKHRGEDNIKKNGDEIGYEAVN